MQKQQITTGTPVPPEWYNAMQTPTYEGTDEDVGHLPLPPNYGKKIQYFKSQSGSVDLSTATGGVVVVLHEGSTTSLQKETLTVTGVSGATAYAIWVIPTGADYELDVVLPLNSQTNTTITLHAGCAGLFAWFNYGSTMNWRGFELPRKDLKAFFKAIDVAEKVSCPAFRVGNVDNGIDIEFDLEQSHTATYLGLVFGALSGSTVIHFPLIHVWKQATFEKDVTVKADVIIEKTLSILQSLTVSGQITADQVNARNTPSTTVSIGNPTQEGGDVSYLEWQLKGVWQVGQVKKIFNDTGHDINQVVFVPTHAGGATVGTWKNISFPAYTYREFTCVGHESGVGSQFAILAPSA